MSSVTRLHHGEPKGVFVLQHNASQAIIQTALIYIQIGSSGPHTVHPLFDEAQETPDDTLGHLTGTTGHHL